MNKDLAKRVEKNLLFENFSFYTIKRQITIYIDNNTYSF